MSDEADSEVSDYFAGHRDARGRFLRGSPGRPPGYRNRATRAVEGLLAGEAERLTRTLIALALAGDVGALKIVFDRIAPPRRDHAVSEAIKIPPLNDPADARRALAEVVDGLASGRLTVGEAAALVSAVRAWLDAASPAAPSGPIRISWIDENEAP